MNRCDPKAARRGTVRLALTQVTDTHPPWQKRDYAPVQQDGAMKARRLNAISKLLKLARRDHVAVSLRPHAAGRRLFFQALPHRASLTRSALNAETGRTRVMAGTSGEGKILNDAGPLGKPKDPTPVQHKALSTTSPLLNENELLRIEQCVDQVLRIAESLVLGI